MAPHNSTSAPVSCAQRRHSCFSAKARRSATSARLLPLSLARPHPGAPLFPLPSAPRRASARPAGAARVEVLTTPWNEEGGWLGRDVTYLDRHPILCAEDALLAQFKIETREVPGVYNKKHIRYSYTCVGAGRFTGRFRDVRANEITGVITFLDMDGLNMSCPQDYALQGFSGPIKREFSNGWPVSWIAPCMQLEGPLSCSKRATPWAAAGRGELRNLEKHDIRCEPPGGARTAAPRPDRVDRQGGAHPMSRLL